MHFWWGRLRIEPLSIPWHACPRRPAAEVEQQQRGTKPCSACRCAQHCVVQTTHKQTRTSLVGANTVTAVAGSEETAATMGQAWMAAARSERSGWLVATS